MFDYLHDDIVNRLKSITKRQKHSVPLSGEDNEDLKRLLNLADGEYVSDKISEELITTIRILGNDICHRPDLKKWVVVDRSSHTYSSEHEQAMQRSVKYLRIALSKLQDLEQWENEAVVKRHASAVFRKPVGELEDMRRQCKVVPSDVVEVHCREGSDENNINFRRTDLDGSRRFLRVIGFVNCLLYTSDAADD